MYKKIFVILLVFITAFAGILWAEKSLERIANEKGVEGETLFNEGKFLEAASKFETAIAKLKEAVKKEGIPLDNEKISKWLENTFQGYFQGKNFENAIRILDERLKLDPDNYKLTNNKAIILKKYLNKVDEAIIVLKNYNNKKRSFKVEKKIAGYYSAIEDYQNAVKWYKKAYELKKDSKVIKNIANLYIKLGKNAEAIKAYEGFIITNPKESVLAKTYKNMGSLYEDLKNMPKAIEYYEKSIKMKYDNNIVLLLTTKYYDNDAYDKALEKITLLLKNKPGNSDAIYYRAMIEYNRDEKDASKADFQLLLKDPKYGKIAKGFIESIESEGYTESSNTENDKLKTLYSSGLLKKFKVNVNEAWVNPSVWESIDYDTKLGICKMLAQECDKAGSSGRITIINNMSGDKLAKYSQAFGYKNLK